MFKKFIFIGAIVLLSGCATVTKGTKDTVEFQSNPPGAKVTVMAQLKDGAKMGPYTCIAPCKMEMKRNKTWNVTFELDGYQTSTGVLTPKFSADGGAGLAGNILIGGIIGAGIDAGTGATNDLEPNPFIANLIPIGSSAQGTITEAPDNTDTNESSTGSEEPTS